MSDLTKFLRSLGTFFAGTVSGPNPNPAMVTAAQQVQAAATAVEGALPAMAKYAADAALATAGPIGVASTPFVNGFIDTLIAELTARKTVVISPQAQAGPTGSGA